MRANLLASESKRYVAMKFANPLAIIVSSVVEQDLG